MRTIKTMDDMVGRYGQPGIAHWGVLTDHLHLAKRLGHEPAVAADGTATIAGEFVLCSEVIEVWSEDGRSDGRCGQPAVVNEYGDLIWCVDHFVPGYRDECEHGMSAALCAGPGHYPQDY